MPEIRSLLIDGGHVLAAVLFIFGLKRLSSPKTARSGNRLAAIGMGVALIATLLDRQILSFTSIVVGTLLGAALGVYSARRVQMTAMPQMVALFNGMGGATAALVSVAEFLKVAARGGDIPAGEGISIMLGTAIGAVSFTGSLIAYGKLQELLSGKPFLFPGQRFVNALLVLAIAATGAVAVMQGSTAMVWALFAISLVLGVLFVIPIGGGDMPVVISILNSLTGVAAALTGFVLHNMILVVAGVLVGASGTLLTVLMGEAMNRSIASVLFGGFGAGPAAAGGAAVDASQLTVRPTTVDDAAVMLAYARKVVIVPGYGLAVAEAQHAVRSLANELEKRGVDVKYAIHPVAGRMPGHMNVLLAEANIPYDQLQEMEQVNGDLAHTDVALVVGANDVVNPAAREDPASPIFGMPILDVDYAKNVIVLKRGMSHGFAGIDNSLFYKDRTRMLFGDARKSLVELTEAVKAA